MDIVVYFQVFNLKNSFPLNARRHSSRTSSCTKNVPKKNVGKLDVMGIFMQLDQPQLHDTYVQKIITTNNPGKKKKNAGQQG